MRASEQTLNIIQKLRKNKFFNCIVYRYLSWYLPTQIPNLDPQGSMLVGKPDPWVQVYAGIPMGIPAPVSSLRCGMYIVIRKRFQSHCMHPHITCTSLFHSKSSWILLRVHNIQLPIQTPSLAPPAQCRMEIKCPQNGSAPKRHSKAGSRLI